MIRLYKNLKRSPWNKIIDMVRTISHTTLHGKEAIIFPEREEIPPYSKSFHFNNYTILFDNNDDINHLITVLTQLRNSELTPTNKRAQ